MNYGEKIKKMTQSEFAQKLYISDKTIYRYLISLLDNCAKCLNVNNERDIYYKLESNINENKWLKLSNRGNKKKNGLMLKYAKNTT